MIHYHGADIYPIESAIKIYNGRHIFVSFAYPTQLELAAEVAQSFALDNGAFTTWRQKKIYDFIAYYEWVMKWVDHPGFDFALITDVIDGNISDNKKFIKDWPFRKSQGVPVWHLHEPLHWFLELCQEFPRVAIGSSGEYAKIGDQKWWHRMADAFHYVSVDGKPISKIHGLRMLDPKIFSVFPFSSADSTNVARHHNDSGRIYSPKDHRLNGLIITHNIEKQQSAPDLKGIPQQSNLFQR